MEPAQSRWHVSLRVQEPPWFPWLPLGAPQSQREGLRRPWTRTLEALGDKVTSSHRDAGSRWQLGSSTCTGSHQWGLAISAGPSRRPQGMGGGPDGLQSWDKAGFHGRHSAPRVEAPLGAPAGSREKEATLACEAGRKGQG